MKMLLALGTMAILTGAWGADRMAVPPAADCRTCHTSDRPTREKPALVSCPRQTIWGQFPLSKAPASITMNELSDSYGPVRFPHRAHAEMAQMGGGCYSCHHYNQARPIFKCSACHAPARARADLSKPDLKAARHRLCVQCHLQWSHSSECDSCHARRGAATGEPKGFAKTALPGPIVYDTASPQGRFVTFRHEEHVKQFGLQCTACHLGQTCVGCHESGRKSPLAQAEPRKAGRSMETLHKPCFSCHAEAQCVQCHQGKP
jgi:hypothetical protein